MKKNKQIQKKKNNFLNKFNKKERFIISLSLFLILLFIFLIYFLIFFEYRNTEVIEEEIEEIREEIEIEKINHLSPRFIDGVLVENNLANLYPVAIILDNDPKNRYPNGLEKASLVYELPTEGGSSRFLAIFHSNIDLEKIGPIRSARPYFIDLAQDSSALLVHCGGSPQALAQLAQENITSLNEFYYERYFWRDKNLSAPNNIFITSSSWQKFLENQNLKQIKKASWQFIQENEDLVEIEADDKSIFINYSKNYQRNWHYNQELNLYEISGDINKIRVKNLIFHYTSSRVLDDQLRLEINLLGNDKAVICQFGSCQEGSWRRKSEGERLRYYDKNNEELNFISGSTWISIISAGAYIDY